MKITMSFKGDVAGTLTLNVDRPNRWTFAKMATALWHSYRALQAGGAKGKEDPCAIVITGPTGPGFQGKIEAIRAIRIVTNMGLKEAKDLVEAISPGRPQIIRVSTPEARKQAFTTLQAGGLTVESLFVSGRSPLKGASA